MMFRKLSCMILFMAATFCVGAQTQRKVALLNMNGYNQETNNSRYQSAYHLMLLTGIPFDTTSVLDTALQYPVVLTGARIMDTAFNNAERNQVKNYVNAGGVLITSSLRDTSLFHLFGITLSESDDELYAINWNTGAFPQYFDLVDDSLEYTVSLGDTDVFNFFTRAYTLGTGQSLGGYEDGRCALVMNTTGLGKTYALGPDFRDIVLRNQLNLDQDAQRSYSNGFEPGTDVFVFIVRNIIRSHIAHSVYKYTSPENTSSVLLITHDIDSKTGIDTMVHFSDFEYAAGIPAQYNITTRYVHDGWMTGFYLGSWPQVHALIGKGHTLASHSVGHFPDFDQESVFPYGTTGNTAAVYQPAYHSGITTGGTVMGEVEVSKNLLQNDHGVNIRSFRAGHLCYPDSLGMALETMGYSFNSTHSANNVLTGFPYRAYNDISFSGAPTSLLEIPMTISDVFSGNTINDTNYLQKVHTWAKVSRKYDRNNAPITLLIHPNRLFKLQALESFLDSIPATMKPYAFESYGEFWRKRDSLLFHTELSNDTLYVRMDNDLLDERQSFVIDDTGLDTVLFFDVHGQALDFTAQTFSPTQKLWYRQPDHSATNELQEQPFTFGVYPNPSKGTINLVTAKSVEARVTITDLAGKQVFTETYSGTHHQVYLSSFASQSGVFFVQLTSQGQTFTRKVMYFHE